MVYHAYSHEPLLIPWTAMAVLVKCSQVHEHIAHHHFLLLVSQQRATETFTRAFWVLHRSQVALLRAMYRLVHTACVVVCSPAWLVVSPAPSLRRCCGQSPFLILRDGRLGFFVNTVPNRRWAPATLWICGSFTGRGTSTFQAKTSA